MKLMMVTPYYPPKIGGLENYVYNLVQHLLRDSTLHIIIITSNHKQPTFQKETVNKRYTIYRLPIQFTFSNTPIHLGWYTMIKKIIAHEKPDIINAHAPVPYIADVVAVASSKVPFILTYHAGSMRKNHPVLDIIIGIYEGILLRKLCERADRIICYSTEFIQGYLSRYKQKLTYIPPGVDTTLFAPPTEKKATHHVLYVGKLEKSAQWKGVPYLLQAVQILKNELTKVHLTLVGEGDMVEAYIHLAQSLGIEKCVTFSGAQQGKELVKYYQKADVFVLPSSTNAESFGIVLIEAMACRVPVVGSRIGGIPGVIDHMVNGILVNPQDPVALAGAIKKILLDTSFANKLGKNGRAKVEKQFTWENSTRKFIKILNEIK